MNVSELKQHLYESKKRLLYTAYHCGKSVHLGGSLSILEVLTVLYREVMRYDVSNPEWSERDRFILSKGHCAAALYAVLSECGFFDEEVLETFMQNDSDLTVHPVMNVRLGIESSNGSLGQGISMAAGIAKAAKIQGREFKVYTLLGNGECNEGAVWEAAMLASHMKLDNLTVIVDNNRMQSDGYSSQVLDMPKLVKKWESFGFQVCEADGHDFRQLLLAFSEKTENKPKVIICNTIKGHGVSFMENKPEWHHNRLTEKLYEQALKEMEEIHD